MSRRILAVFLPRLGAQRLRRRHRVPREQPLATWRMDGNRRLLDSVDAPSLPPGLLHPGQALADAQALCPALRLHPADPAAEAALLNALALWCLRFTPVVATEAPDGLVLDITGASALFGGERALVKQMRDALARSGLSTRVAVAATPGMAVALSRNALNDLVIPLGEEAEALRSTPLGVLRLPANTMTQFRRLGLRNLLDLARQPRAALAQRFGTVVLAVLDDATGFRARPLRSIRPVARFEAARDFPEPISTRAAIDVAAHRLATSLCQSLSRAGQGLRRLSLLAFRVDGDVQERVIGTAYPSWDAAHLLRLLREPLGTLEPEEGFERLVLEATETSPLAPEQRRSALLEESSGARQAVLAALVDRLAQRTAVHRPAPRAAYRPEDACAGAAPLNALLDVPPGISRDTLPGAPPGAPPGAFLDASPGTAAPLPPGWQARERPVQLLPHPEPLDVLAEVPDGPPVRLGWRRKTYRVLRAAGPERLEPPWWEAGTPRARRDYFRLQTMDGPRLWVCRLGENRPDAPARWFVHGYLA